MIVTGYGFRTQVVIMVPRQPLRKMFQSSVAQETRSSRGRVGGPKFERERQGPCMQAQKLTL
jgi:hypothetical protein